MTWILGVNVPPVGWHDTAACLVDETGRVYAMAEEERFTRTKHGVHEQPLNAVSFVLESAGVAPADVDVVAVGWDVPRMYGVHAMRWGFGGPDALLRAIGLTGTGRRPDVVFVDHHRAHAVSGLYAAGVAEAAVLVVDGNGEDESASLFEARRGRPMVRRRRWSRVRSLGIMYAAVSQALGFGILGAGKTMGLASYGRDGGVEPWQLLDDDLTPPFAHTDEDSYDQVLESWVEHIGGLLGRTSLTVDTDTLDKVPEAVRLAWSAQHTVERAIAAMVARAREETGLEDVCLAGGVALNCSANGMLPQPVHAPPIPHDAGVALGAAWSLCDGRPGGPLDPYLGSPVLRAGEELPVASEPLRVDRVVELLCRGAIGALAVGRAEVGPRALGHRSIIALPSAVEVRDEINLTKGREHWRPLAPVARVQDAGRFWSERPTLQRYMLGATQVTAEARAVMPAAVHVDGSVRAQVVDERAGLIHELLGALSDAGVPPVLINTSLNTRGEPLVNTATEALRAFDAIGLDFVVVGDRLVVR
ncbi:carbamoyltransferase [Streptosporangium fragile]|uniref:Carbamoyltransferase n=1 Tax=Streptosporangium fragile TaxID=46186 RepID=A0ABN3VPX2_9ACTN